MDANAASDAAGKSPTTTERTSDRELVITRSFKAPARIVFEAWTTPELIKRWWAPAAYGMSFVSCEADVRAGGSYRFVLSHPASEEPGTFFGRYLEVTPPSRLVWTNEDQGDAGQVTTVTFEETAGWTRVVIHELYPSKQALDEAFVSGATGWAEEMFEQLDDLLAAA